MIVKVSLLIFFFFAVQLRGQEPAREPLPSIHTTGEATITAQPDQAQIDLGVVTQANSSQAAAEQNARKLEAALSRLRQLLGPAADIKTISYALQPNYRYPKEGGDPQITGYTATNIVRVTLDDLTRVGSAIDVAAQAGANRVQNLRFMLRRADVVHAQALREAATRARMKADALASALGLKIVRTLSVTETSPGVVPLRDATFARVEAAATPIEPGTIEVRATVSLRVEISP